MEGSIQVPPEVQAAADRLGVPVETLLQSIQPQEGQPAAEPIVANPEAVQVVAAPAETQVEALQRELAESRQETQQVRRMAQVATEGRVIGSSGGGVVGNLATDLPNLGMVEPGIRYEFLNGLITEEELARKLDPLLAALLKKHEGGAI